MAIFKKTGMCFTAFLLCLAISCATAAAIGAQAKEPAGRGASASAAGAGEEKTISFDFPDTDIRVAIETIAIKIGINIVAGPEVKGRISMKLDNVPWQKALDILLKTYGYGYVWDDGIVRVMSMENLKKEDMMTRVFSVSYGSPSEIARGVNSLLSKEGKADANAGARSILVKDFPTNLSMIEKTIEKLDLLSREELAKKEAKVEKAEVSKEEPTIAKDIILDFKDTPIREVMAQISALSGLYISVGEEVVTNVTLSTGGNTVPWHEALATIMRTANLSYEPASTLISDLKAGDFITIRTKQKIIEINAENKTIAENVPLKYVVFELKFIDAADVAKLLDPGSFEESEPAAATSGGEPQPQAKQQQQKAGTKPRLLSPRGCVSVLEMSGQTGWAFNAGEAYPGLKPEGGATEKATERKPSKSRKLLVGEIPSNMGKICDIINKIDVMPYQVVIEAKVVEVARDVLDDIGIDWGTGADALQQTWDPLQLQQYTYRTLDTTTNFPLLWPPETYTYSTPNPTYSALPAGLMPTGQTLTQRPGNSPQTASLFGANSIANLDSNLTPAAFSPNSIGLTSRNAGFKFRLTRVAGTQFDALLHALEEKYGANILSAPKITTFSNQEATIMVGQQIPIVSTSIIPSAIGQPTVSPNFRGFLPVGVRLSVVPQVSDNKFINMILHPSVTTRLYDKIIRDPATGLEMISVPVVDTREADTQVLVRNGETIVIGGLLKDEKKDTRIGIPILSDLPFVGAAFRRTTTNTKKLDLLIFVTARIVLKGNNDRSTYSYTISKQEGERLLAKSKSSDDQGQEE